MSNSPTKEDIKFIKKYSFKNLEKFHFKKDGYKPLLEHLESIWWLPDWGFKLAKRARKNNFGEQLLELQLHTAGRSDNEEIISALETTFFWRACWTKTIRGGHYYFEIPVRKKNTKASGGR